MRGVRKKRASEVAFHSCKGWREPTDCRSCFVASSKLAIAFSVQSILPCSRSPGFRKRTSTHVPAILKQSIHRLHERFGCMDCPPSSGAEGPDHGADAPRQPPRGHATAIEQLGQQASPSGCHPFQNRRAMKELGQLVGPIPAAPLSILLRRMHGCDVSFALLSPGGREEQGADLFAHRLKPFQ